jgi:hypothetical protein
LHTGLKYCRTPLEKRTHRLLFNEVNRSYTAVAMLLLRRLKRELKKKDLAKNGEARRFFGKIRLSPFPSDPHAMLPSLIWQIGNANANSGQKFHSAIIIITKCASFLAPPFPIINKEKACSSSWITTRVTTMKQLHWRIFCSTAVYCVCTAFVASLSIET